MKSSKNQRIFSKISLIIFINISKKIDVSTLKKLVDFIFERVEDIVIRLDKLLPLYLKYYEDLIDKEIRLANITNNSYVAHIGCGPIPSSSILVAKKTGAKVVGIDKNPYAVKNAQKCISMFPFKENIEIKNAEASDFSINDFDAILISHGIDNIDNFLENISKSVKRNAIILLRTFSSNSGGLSESDAYLNDIFKVIEIVNHKNHGSVITVKLLKK
jgi:precorrin-6B methylase 2